MGSVISSCHQPTTTCCRWTTDTDGEVTVQGNGRPKAAEEEPRMNFDTNVIGPPNVNLVTSGTSLQELKFLDERTHPKTWEAPDHPERTSKEREFRTAAELKRAVKAIQPKQPAPKGGLPVSAKAAKSKSPLAVLPVVSKSPAKSPPAPLKKEKVYTIQPKYAGDFRSMPSPAWTQLYSNFPCGRTEKEKTASPEPSPPAVVRTLLAPSVSPSLWSPVHKRWTCQRLRPSEPSEPSKAPAAPAAAPEVSEAPEVEVPKVLEEAPGAPEVLETAEAREVALVEGEKMEKVQKAAPAKALRLCSTAPALWSSVHRKWCGPVLQMRLAEVPTLLAKKKPQPPAVEDVSTVAPKSLAKVYAGITDTDAKVEEKGKVAAVESFAKPRLTISFSASPALYSKWHRQWTGFLPKVSLQ